MGIMADRLDSMVVTANSPDGQVTATVSKREQVDIEFRRGAYRRYDERTLEHQLARMATLAWIGYRRGYFEALSAANGETIRGDEEEWDANRRRFQQARAAVVAEGASPTGWIRAEATGLTHWRVRIEDGALTQLTEDEFRSEARGTVAALLMDYDEKMLALKDEFFDLNLPDKKRR
jgi:hypothetical protein